MGETNDNNPNDVPTFREMKHKYDGRVQMDVDGRRLISIHVSKPPAYNFEPRVNAWDVVNEENVQYTLEGFHNAVEN